MPGRTEFVGNHRAAHLTVAQRTMEHAPLSPSDTHNGVQHPYGQSNLSVAAYTRARLPWVLITPVNSAVKASYLCMSVRPHPPLFLLLLQTV